MNTHTEIGRDFFPALFPYVCSPSIVSRVHFELPSSSDLRLSRIDKVTYRTSD